MGQPRNHSNQRPQHIARVRPHPRDQPIHLPETQHQSSVDDRIGKGVIDLTQLQFTPTRFTSQKVLKHLPILALHRIEQHHPI